MRISTKSCLMIAAALTVLAGCSRSPKPEVAVAPPAVAVPGPMPKPRPPANAAANLTIPPVTPDGGYATVNRDLSVDATIWHLRSALNVAALQCDPANTVIADRYNAMLKGNAARFARAHKVLEAEYRKDGANWQDRFDDSMTRVYNYFAQPPVRTAFCAAALPMLDQAATLPTDQLDSFAPDALARLDMPFVDFYRAYDRYRVDLARWQANQAPRLRVDPAILLASSEVTNNGRIQIASR